MTGLPIGMAAETAIASATCTVDCWLPAPCPDHGTDMTPRGRSAPLEMHQCCDNYADPTINPRHLWSEHDDARHYTDPHGWAMHLASCHDCREQHLPRDQW